MNPSLYLNQDDKKINKPKQVKLPLFTLLHDNLKKKIFIVDKEISLALPSLDRVKEGYLEMTNELSSIPFDFIINGTELFESILAW